MPRKMLLRYMLRDAVVEAKICVSCRCWLAPFEMSPMVYARLCVIALYAATFAAVFRAMRMPLSFDADDSLSRCSTCMMMPRYDAAAMPPPAMHARWLRVFSPRHAHSLPPATLLFSAADAAYDTRRLI